MAQAVRLATALQRSDFFAFFREFGAVHGHGAALLRPRVTELRLVALRTLCRGFGPPGLPLEWVARQLGFEGDAWDIQHRVLRQSNSLYNPLAFRPLREPYD